LSPKFIGRLGRSVVHSDSAATEKIIFFVHALRIYSLLFFSVAKLYEPAGPHIMARGHPTRREK
jgi:hypothetical protein